MGTRSAGLLSAHSDVFPAVMMAGLPGSCGTVAEIPGRLTLFSAGRAFDLNCRRPGAHAPAERSMT